MIDFILLGSPARVVWVGQCRKCLSITDKQGTPEAAHAASVLCCEPVPYQLTASGVFAVLRSQERV